MSQFSQFMSRTPLSLEAMARERAAADEAAARPVYTPKRDRGLAPAASNAIPTASSGPRHGTKRANNDDFNRPATYRAKADSAAAGASTEELEAIRKRYLGKGGEGKRALPHWRRNVLSEDWDASDDTSKDVNPLYDAKATVALGFGKGFIAGVDRREQQLNQRSVYDELTKQRRIQFGSQKDHEKVAERDEKARQREEQRRRVQRHWSEKPMNEMTRRDWVIFNEEANMHNVTIQNARHQEHPSDGKQQDVMRLRLWEDAGFPPALMDAINRAGYKAPTPIQRVAIPYGMRRRDVLGVAETGSGKTCAFVLPMVCYILSKPPFDAETRRDGPYAIILAPTRELVKQIEDEAKKFAEPLGFSVTSVIGGHDIRAQSMRMEQGAEIVVATPGRLVECIEKRYLVLNQCDYVVLDEADRMLDMNFMDDVEFILDSMQTTGTRQTFLFSATMPTEIRELAKKYLKDPVSISIGDRRRKAVETITQRVYFVAEPLKRKKLLEVLKLNEPPFIVFMNTKKTVEALNRFLNEQGWNSTWLHGGKAQDQREASLEAFKSKRFDVLVATDVAGRGIDIPDVKHVINFDVPHAIEAFMHRCGRTGRAGKEGIATSFLTAEDTAIMYDLKQLLIRTESHIPKELDRAEAANAPPGGDAPDHNLLKEQVFI